ncbi:MAG: hypothetical protein JO250_17735 [Armatimonadetes bacterium]|nr:hypothetical protein [Armatimonadota bacterium]
MKDEYLIRMIAETCKTLSEIHWPTECRYLPGSYNALLQAARTNHPDDPFLKALPAAKDEGSRSKTTPIPPGPFPPPAAKDEGEAVTTAEMNILFAQLRIALEALQDSNTALVATTHG